MLPNSEHKSNKLRIERHCTLHTIMHYSLYHHAAAQHHQTLHVAQKQINAGTKHHSALPYSIHSTTAYCHEGYTAS
jgi:hypothetical protein